MAPGGPVAALSKSGRRRLKKRLQLAQASGVTPPLPTPAPAPAPVPAPAAVKAPAKASAPAALNDMTAPATTMADADTKSTGWVNRMVTTVKVTKDGKIVGATDQD